MNIKNEWEREPDFVDGEVKWWHVKSITEYATRENLHGISLPDIRGWVVQVDNDLLTYALVDNERGQAIFGATSLDAIGSHIDMMKIQKHYEIEGE